MARTRKYGPIYRSWWGPKAIVHLTRPEHVELILNNSRNIDKSFGYDFIEPWLGTGLLTSRGKFSVGLGTVSVRRYESTIYAVVFFLFN